MTDTLPTEKFTEVDYLWIEATKVKVEGDCSDSARVLLWYEIWNDSGHPVLLEGARWSLPNGFGFGHGLAGTDASRSTWRPCDKRLKLEPCSSLVFHLTEDIGRAGPSNAPIAMRLPKLTACVVFRYDGKLLQSKDNTFDLTPSDGAE